MDCIDRRERVYPRLTTPRTAPPRQRKPEVFGFPKIAEHVTRSRLELWRVAVLKGEPGEAVESLWDSYLAAETAILGAGWGSSGEF
jgi:hypothetical protein